MKDAQWGDPQCISAERRCTFVRADAVRQRDGRERRIKKGGGRFFCKIERGKNE